MGRGWYMYANSLAVAEFARLCILASTVVPSRPEVPPPSAALPRRSRECATAMAAVKAALAAAAPSELPTFEHFTTKRKLGDGTFGEVFACLLYTSPSPRDQRGSRMPSSA